MNVGLIINFSSIVIIGKRKFCECDARFYLFIFLSEMMNDIKLYRGTIWSSYVLNCTQLATIFSIKYKYQAFKNKYWFTGFQ